MSPLENVKLLSAVRPAPGPKEHFTLEEMEECYHDAESVSAQSLGP